MSATGRNKTGNERHPEDFYETPSFAVEALLNAIPVKDEYILDPGCGTGAIGRVLSARCLPVAGIELNAERAAIARKSDAYYEVEEVDYLSAACPTMNVPLIISNPPYIAAQAFIEAGLRDLTPDGRAFYLLRLNFLGSKRRYFSKIWPHLRSVYVLPKRPKFRPGGSGDACEYGWFEFRKYPFPHRPPTIEWLDTYNTGSIPLD